MNCVILMNSCALICYVEEIYIYNLKFRLSLVKYLQCFFFLSTHGFKHISPNRLPFVSPFFIINDFELVITEVRCRAVTSSTVNAH